MIALFINEKMEVVFTHADATIEELLLYQNTKRFILGDRCYKNIGSSYTIAKKALHIVVIDDEALKTDVSNHVSAPQ